MNKTTIVSCMPALSLPLLLGCGNSNAPGQPPNGVVPTFSGSSDVSDTVEASPSDGDASSAPASSEASNGGGSEVAPPGDSVEEMVDPIGIDGNTGDDEGNPETADEMADPDTGGEGRGAGEPGEIFKPSFILGADISWTLEQEHAGRRYSDRGQIKSIERILVDHGFNYVRLRTFVCPDCPGGYAFNNYSPAGPDEAWCDTDHTIEMAKRVKACGMGVFLDFHMSDIWASIGEQHVPSAWAGMSPGQMQAAAYDYCKGVLDQMVAEGVRPDMVQVGNEINSHVSGVSINDWGAFSGLINAGVRAVRDTDPSIVVVMQHGRPRPDGNFRQWVDRLLSDARPVDADVICGSTYGTTNNGQDWRDEFGYVINTYGLPVMSCEYTDNRRDLINGVMRGLDNGMGLGSFIWEPTQYGDRKPFDFAGGTYATNANMNAYDGLAQSYGLPVPSRPASELAGTSCQ